MTMATMSKQGKSERIFGDVWAAINHYKSKNRGEVPKLKRILEEKGIEEWEWYAALARARKASPEAANMFYKAMGQKPPKSLPAAHPDITAHFFDAPAEAPDMYPVSPGWDTKPPAEPAAEPVLHKEPEVTQNVLCDDNEPEKPEPEQEPEVETEVEETTEADVLHAVCTHMSLLEPGARRRTLAAAAVFLGVPGAAYLIDEQREVTT